ncbi:ATP-binding protein [Geofilum sp. OHC36d9]|uniref:ATP-binding protein n=1 Tax=Geofilum sp. OHC36d9 TaxID=3458413 RepID=UPI0040337BBE
MLLLILLVRENKNDGFFINTAGKQRYLSQKISKTSLLYLNSTDSTKDLEYVNVLEADLHLFETNNEVLLTNTNSPIILNSLIELQPDFEVICDNAKNLIQNRKNADYLNKILDVESGFLHNMNEIVQRYEKENKTEINKFLFYLALSKMLLIVVLALFILKIIRPAIFENKRYQDIVSDQNSKLLKLNKDKDLFITVLAHDLKSPFNSILGFLQLLEHNIRSNDINETESQIKIINNSANQVYNLLESLLNWARMQAGKVPFLPQKLQLSLICSETIELLKTNSIFKEIELNHFVEDDISIYADKAMISTVLRNLVSNAIKFTESGGVININAEINDAIVLITVSDNGIGMNNEVMNKLFDITQLYTTVGTKKEKGTGLGLVLCKAFVEKHNGTIWVESDLGIGSNFKFTLPIADN